jgi:hypothetical protein
MKSADAGPSTGDETDQPDVPPRPESRQVTPQRGSLQYDAFISYSRGNFEVADKFERDLETFPLPRESASGWAGDTSTFSGTSAT